MEHRAKGKEQEKKIHAPDHARGRKVNLLPRAAVLLMSMQVILFTFCLQEVQTQITDHEIASLEEQLKEVRAKLVPLDGRLDSLKRRAEAVTAEKSKLERTKPSGFLGRIRRVFWERKLRSLYTELQALSNRISILNRERQPLIKELVALADKLVDRLDSRMKTLMEAILSNQVAARAEAMKQVSSLWQLAEATRETRNQYAPPPLGSEQTVIFPPFLSDDPEEIRLGIAILEDAAAEARAKAAELEEQIEELRRRKRLLELRMEIRQSDRESGTEAIDDSTAHIPWDFSDAAIKSEIDEIGKKIEDLSAKMQKYNADAERFKSQIDVELKGKSEDD